MPMLLADLIETREFEQCLIKMMLLMTVMVMTVVEMMVMLMTDLRKDSLSSALKSPIFAN